MKYRFNYGNEVITLPLSAAQYIGVASKEKIRVLFSLAAEPAMTLKKRAESLGLDESAVAAAISYWTAVEVISADHRSAREERAEAPGPAVGETKKPRRSPADAPVSADGGERESTGAKANKKRDGGKTIALLNETPHMTTAELTGAAADEENARLLEHCQQLMGRVFNAAEAERIVSVRSYLGVSADFIALLCKSLKDEGRLTVRSLESTAIELHDAGITSMEELIEYFDRREKARALEGKVRSLYGLGSRALSASERKILERWAKLGISEDMIEFAFELTVDTAGSASLNYTNAIIENWAASGIKTVKEAKKREEEFRTRTQSKASRKKGAAAKKPSEETHSSFDTDDFFEKALRRSYGDEFFEDVIKGTDPDDEDGEN